MNSSSPARRVGLMKPRISVMARPPDMLCGTWPRGRPAAKHGHPGDAIASAALVPARAPAGRLETPPLGVHGRQAGECAVRLVRRAGPRQTRIAPRSAGRRQPHLGTGRPSASARAGVAGARTRPQIERPAVVLPGSGDHRRRLQLALFLAGRRRGGRPNSDRSPRQATDCRPGSAPRRRIGGASWMTSCRLCSRSARRRRSDARRRAGRDCRRTSSRRKMRLSSSSRRSRRLRRRRRSAALRSAGASSRRAA